MVENHLNLPIQLPRKNLNAAMKRVRLGVQGLERSHAVMKSVEQMLLVSSFVLLRMYTPYLASKMRMSKHSFGWTVCHNSERVSLVYHYIIQKLRDGVKLIHKVHLSLLCGLWKTKSQRLLTLDLMEKITLSSILIKNYFSLKVNNWSVTSLLFSKHTRVQDRSKEELNSTMNTPKSQTSSWKLEKSFSERRSQED